MRLLLDANVPRWAAVGAYKKIREQTIKWGPIITTRDVLERCPPPYDRAPRFFQQNIPYIPAIARAAEARNRITFYTYQLIEMEFWNVPPSFDWADRDIRRMFGCKELPFDVDMSGIIMSAFDPECFPRYLNSIPDRIADEKLKSLIRALGAEASRDCVHMWFVDYQGLDGLVTVDKAFAGRFNQIRAEHGYMARAFLPADLARRLRISPVGPDWFAARADPHIFYVEHQSTPVGEYLFENVGARRMFCNT